MKTLIKNLLLIVLFGTFTACEKTEVQTPSENTDLSITASIPSIDGLKSHVSHTPRMALYLDGVDDYIMVPDHPSLDMTTGFTVAAWVYMESYVEWASVVTKGGVPDELVVSENNYTLHQSGNTGGGTLPYDTEFGHLRFTNGCVTLPAPMPESVTLMSLRDWHYVTLTYDGSTLRFYLDGRQGPRCKILQSPSPNSPPRAPGRHPASRTKKPLSTCRPSRKLPKAWPIRQR